MANTPTPRDVVMTTRRQLRLQITRWAAALASMIVLLNAVATGGAIAASSANVPGVSEAICAKSADASLSHDKSLPSHSTHKHGLCCFLHNGSLSAVSITRIHVLIDFNAPKVAFRYSDDHPNFIHDPGRSPQSPRAPPA